MRGIVWWVVLVFAVAVVANAAALQLSNQLSSQLYLLLTSGPTGSGQDGVPDPRLYLLVSDGVFLVAQLVTVGAGFSLWTRVRGLADRPFATGRLLVAIGATVLAFLVLAQLAEDPNGGGGISLFGVDLITLFINGGGGLHLASAMVIVLGLAEMMHSRRAATATPPDRPDA
jgi:hypothetical protein